MLVSFSAKNYKSFYDEVTLDMRIEVDESNREEIENNPFVYKINNDYISKLCILYGHNGSGKSNLLNAISYLSNININHLPSNYEKLFIPNMIYGKDENTEFNLEFYNNNNLYHYKIILDNKNEKIEYELLKENDDIVFERENSNIKNGNDFFIGIKGIPTQMTVISHCYSVDDYKKNVNKHRKIFVENFSIYLDNTKLWQILFFEIDNIYSSLTKSKTWNIYKKLISLADVGIDDIKIIKKEKVKVNDIFEDFMNRKNKYKLTSIHKNYEDDFKKIESDGTKTYANNLYYILDSIKDGRLNILDEFNGVQSELLELIISLFQKNMFEDLKKQTAQLILSTHDTNLMSLKNTLLNHYWFLNKEDNKSELYCAADFENLKKEYLEKEYKGNNLKAKYSSRLFEVPSKFFIDEEK